MEQQRNKQMPNPVNVRKRFTYLRLEPYEGKLSRTVLRRERRGNPPDPADDDAFLVLKIVKDKTKYEIVENSYPHDGEYRIKGFPFDSFHIAIRGHKGRLQNILKSPGIDPIEKALHKQRLDAIKAGQKGYLEMQGKALTNEE